MLCEMCSSKEVRYKINIEGSKLNVCEKCSSFGKVVARLTVVDTRKDKPKQGQDIILPKKRTETVQLIRLDYPKQVKAAREKLGLKQEDFAKMLNTKESLLNNIESGHMKPDLALARKLEKVLKISIVEQVEVESGGGVPEEKKKGSGFTIGDMINIK